MRPLLIKRIKEMVDPKGAYLYRFRSFTFGDSDVPLPQWTDIDYDNLDNSQLLLLFEQALIVLYS